MCIACKIKLTDTITALKHFANGGSPEHKAAIESLKLKLSESLNDKLNTAIVPKPTEIDVEDQVYQLIVEEELVEEENHDKFNEEIKQTKEPDQIGGDISQGEQENEIEDE